MTEKEYKIEIDPGILELLGPSLYTNHKVIFDYLFKSSYMPV